MFSTFVVDYDNSRKAKQHEDNDNKEEARPRAYIRITTLTWMAGT